MKKYRILAAVVTMFILFSTAGCKEKTEEISADLSSNKASVSEESMIDSVDSTESEPSSTVSKTDMEERPASSETKFATASSEPKIVSKVESNAPAQIDLPQETQPSNSESSRSQEPTASAALTSSESGASGIPKQSIEETTPFTQADHERIVAEVTAYAESYQSKGFLFECKESIAFSWELGFFGTPRVDRDGVEGVIDQLKYHIDRIYQTSTDPANGITTDYMTYKVVQLEIDGGIAYAVVYGG